jgi:hypothetical protein
MLVLSVAGVRSSVLQLRLIALAPVCRQRMRQKLQIKPKTTNKTKKKKKFFEGFGHNQEKNQCPEEGLSD